MLRRSMMVTSRLPIICHIIPFRMGSIGTCILICID
ncbi:Uncharacterised protein [Segatella copri]|nr:Uncharacterised protein [Segatella copri]